MIADFVSHFMEGRGVLEEKFQEARPEGYLEIVRAVVKVLADSKHLGSPDPNRITEIDWGDYRGTLLYIIAANTYQPSTFWATTVAYGSCAGCDILEDIRGYTAELPSQGQVEDYMTLALHIVQRLQVIGG